MSRDLNPKQFEMNDEELKKRLEELFLLLENSDGGVFIKRGDPVEMDPVEANGDENAEHNLGQVPDGVFAYLECKTTQHDWDVGDRIAITDIAQVSIGYDADSTYIAMDNASLPIIIPKESGNGVSITAANWKLVAIPYRFITGGS